MGSMVELNKTKRQCVVRVVYPSGWEINSFWCNNLSEEPYALESVVG